MKRGCSALLLLLAAALPAQAHFIWILPGPPGDGKASARVVFSDSLAPDSNVPVTKIAKTELFQRSVDGKAAPLPWTAGKDAYDVTLPDQQPRLLGGVCRYGVIQKGNAGPYLLHYYAKTVVGEPNAEAMKTLFLKDWDRFPLDVQPVFDTRMTARALWQGKPLADAEVVLLPPGIDEPIKAKTDRAGLFKLEAPKGQGLYGIRVGHTEAREGELDGKKYKEVRHYFTLVVPMGSTRTFKQVGAKIGAAGDAADPAATKLLADARAARSTWHDFPGFSADLEANFDGKVHKGRLQVSPKGKVKVDLDDADARAWTQREMSSLVGHRLGDGTSLQTPCAFADDNVHHPQGRAIRVLNDELHSGYRIRDRQILEVNRQMKDFRFTISVLENRLNAEKQFLPVAYVVHAWDLSSKVLRSSTTHHHTWQRLGKFDLPETMLVVTATPGALQVRSLRLGNVQLTPAAAPGQ
jgi:hypothetical protein